ncbi:hypothetical protein Agub_g5060 [Astrephomene gubernaculifera]|uniref:Derlin n=1 Tax=Astrephomene gubernaculifera TaxID=47775 RepID=A0AAD3HJS6_9CHLO|nr:hypothetical protein Agub_g5060 [Astrephomene gubernaculifera]
MPPVTATTVGGGPAAWYQSIPPITRAYATAIFVLSLTVRFELFSPYLIYLSWPRVLSHFEIWRLVTTFFYLGGVSFPWLFKMMWLLTYGKTLETSTFLHDPAGFLFMLLFGAGSLLVMSVGAVQLGIRLAFFGSSVIYMIMYVWSRQFPDQQVSIFGLFTIQAFYVPFFFVAVDFLQGFMPWDDILGIVAGHLYFFLHDLYPVTSGRQLLGTPRFLQNLLAGWGVGQRVNTHAASGQDEFRAFRGRGRRLGAE